MDGELVAVVDLELRLLQPDVRNDPQQLLRLLHPEFTKHGASGRVWTYSDVVEATAGTTEPIEVSALAARRLGPDAVLITYRSDAGGRRALRSSVWQRAHGRWLMVFHQGTLAGAPASAVPDPTPGGMGERSTAGTRADRGRAQ